LSSWEESASSSSFFPELCFPEFCFPEFPSSADRDSEEHEVLEFEVFFEVFLEAFLGAFLELGVSAVWGEGPFDDDLLLELLLQEPPTTAPLFFFPVLLLLSFPLAPPPPVLSSPAAAAAKCQLVSSCAMKCRSRSRYWLYNSTSLWPAPSTQSGSTALGHFS